MDKLKPGKSKKIIMVGHYGVGKTSMVRQYVHRMFTDEYLSTIGVKVDKKVVELETVNVTLIIWDIEGSDDHGKLPRSYFMGAHGLLFVVDLTRPETYADIARRISYLESIAPGIKSRIAGNKADLISKQETQNLISKMELKPHFLTSAKTGQNIEETFKSLAEEMI